MIAKGNVRKLLIKIGYVQDLISTAIRCNADDRNPHRFEQTQKSLETALDVCVEATSDFDPINTPNHRWQRTP